MVWFGLALIATLFAKTKRSKKRRLLFSMFLLWFFTNTIIFEAVMGAWELKTTQKKHLVYDYGIVLGGMSYYNEQLGQISFLRASDRIWQAVGAYKRGEVRKLIISGGYGGLLHREHKKEGDFLKDFLIEIGIPEKDILSEAKSKKHT